MRRAIPVRAARGVLSDSPCVDGQHWRWDGVRFMILNPPSAANGSRNDRGCVLRVSVRGHAVLLPADIEAPAERALVQRHTRMLRADVLVAPHHGSAGSSSPTFVAHVDPRMVIYPAGWENRFHFPRPQPLGRYAAIDAQQWITGVQGAVTVEFDSEGIVAVHRWRAEHPRLTLRRCAEARSLPPARHGTRRLPRV